MSDVNLEYKESAGGNYWIGAVLGKEMKFSRVLCGLALPILDRQSAALIILGELFSTIRPPDWTGLGAAVGTWPEVKRELLHFCSTLKPDHIIVENEDYRKQVWPVTDALVGVKPLPLCYGAPEHSVTEIGRQNIQQLIDENRLKIAHLLPILDTEKDQADKALRFCVNWALSFGAFYPGKPRKPLPGGGPIGTRGL